MITLSRYAKGLTLGQRMGLIVGGTWALAYVLFMILLLAAEHFKFSTGAILRLVPWGYLLSGIFGLVVMPRARNSAPGTSLVQQSATRT
jgi:integral membrane sensor domain MASE1